MFYKGQQSKQLAFMEKTATYTMRVATYSYRGIARTSVAALACPTVSKQQFLERSNFRLRVAVIIKNNQLWY